MARGCDPQEMGAHPPHRRLRIVLATNALIRRRVSALRAGCAAATRGVLMIRKHRNRNDDNRTLAQLMHPCVCGHPAEEHDLDEVRPVCNVDECMCQWFKKAGGTPGSILRSLLGTPLDKRPKRK